MCPFKKNQYPIFVYFILFFIAFDIIGSLLDTVLDVIAKKDSVSFDVGYMNEHLINNGRLGGNYLCKNEIRIHTELRKKRYIDEYPYSQSLTNVIALRRTMPNVDITNYPDPNNPFEYAGEIRVQFRNSGSTLSIPYFVRAVIRPNHLRRPGQRETIPSAIHRHLEYMNRDENDEAGHLLASSLGGITTHTNFIPMAIRLNRSYGGHSRWREIEQENYNFLNTNPLSSIEWNLAVVYVPNFTNLRPLGVCLQFTRFINNVIFFESGDICFDNDPTYDCAYLER